jgi:hypothetical protein
MTIWVKISAVLTVAALALGVFLRYVPFYYTAALAALTTVVIYLRERRTRNGKISS